MTGEPVPEIRLPKALPFEAWYPPRGLAWPGPIEQPLPEPLPGSESLASLQQRVAEGLDAGNYLDLNNSNNQAPGATRMMAVAWAPMTVLDSFGTG